jgi:hypothetical protein
MTEPELENHPNYSTDVKTLVLKEVTELSLKKNVSG